VKPKDQRGWTERVDDYLDKMGWGYQDVHGKTNTLQDLYNELKTVLADTKGKMEDVILEKDGDPASLALYQDMLDALNAAGMRVFFATGDANKIFNDMFAKDYGKFDKSGKQIGLDWAKLAGDRESP